MTDPFETEAPAPLEPKPARGRPRKKAAVHVPTPDGSKPGKTPQPSVYHQKIRESNQMLEQIKGMSPLKVRQAIPREFFDSVLFSIRTLSYFGLGSADIGKRLRMAKLFLDLAGKEDLVKLMLDLKRSGDPVGGAQKLSPLAWKTRSRKRLQEGTGEAEAEPPEGETGGA